MIQPLILFSGRNLRVIESAVRTLGRIITSPEGAQAAVDANVLECVGELLESPKEEIRKYAHDILGELPKSHSISA